MSEGDLIEIHRDCSPEKSSEDFQKEPFEGFSDGLRWNPVRSSWIDVIFKTSLNSRSKNSGKKKLKSFQVIWWNSYMNSFANFCRNFRELFLSSELEGQDIIVFIIRCS